MQVTIHRGTDEIGGSCVEIRTARTTIFIDAGLPLDDRPVRLPDRIHSADAVLISHCHQDHYGLLEGLRSKVPVFMGAAAQAFVNAARVFQRKHPLACDFKPMHAWRRFAVGDFEITPYLVDHSAPEAFAFLVTTGGKRLFYSGDFRAHGRKSKLFDNFIQEPPPNIDALLLEGTMLERDNKAFPTEKSIETAICQVLQETQMALLICSGQNIDRLVSAYRAALRANRELVLDIYTAWILEEFGRFADTVPQMGWDKVRVLTKGRLASAHYKTIQQHPQYFGGFAQKLFNFAHTQIDMDAIARFPERYLIKTNTVMDLIRTVNPASAVVIYAMWAGYLSEHRSPSNARMREQVKAMPHVDLRLIHTSGHATIESLKAVVATLAPKRVIPIHTEHKGKYDQHFRNVECLSDRQAYAL